MGVINPIRLLLLSFFIWLFFFSVTPSTYLYNGTLFFPVLTLILYVSFFYLGFISIKKSQIKPKALDSPKKIKQITYLLFIIGFIGVLIKLYIGFFVSEIFTADDVFIKRLEAMNEEFSGGLLGVFSALLYPFSYIVLLISIYHYKLFSKSFLFIAFITGVYPMIETYFMGGRTIIALLGSTLIFVTLVSFYYNTSKNLIRLKLFKIPLFIVPRVLLKKWVWITLIVLMGFFITYSIRVVNERLTVFNYGDYVFTVWEQEDYQWVKFDEEFKEQYYKSSQEEKNKMLGIYNLKHYFTHGVFEYVRLVNDLDKTTGYYYGQYEFNVFFKFFRKFGLPFYSFEEMSVVVKRQAVYQTFWGPFYIDFGILGVVIMFLWGRFVKKVYEYSKMGRIQYIIFYGYIATIIISSFFINFIVGSSSYYLFAFFITLLLFKLLPEKTKITLKTQ